MNYSIREMFGSYSITVVDGNTATAYYDVQEGIIKVIKKLQQENNQLKENNQSMQEEMCRTWEKLNIIKELRELLTKYLCTEEYCSEVGTVTTRFVEDLGNILNELEGNNVKNS